MLFEDRPRGCDGTKNTFVSTALSLGVKIACLEQQTSESYATLGRHYGKWMPREGASELRLFADVEPTLFGSLAASRWVLSDSL